MMNRLGGFEEEGDTAKTAHGQVTIWIGQVKQEQSKQPPANGQFGVNDSNTRNKINYLQG